MSMQKEFKYDGPKLPEKKPGRIPNRTKLEAISYLKQVFVQAKMYEEAAEIRDMERKFEDKYNMKIVYPGNNKKR